MTRPNTLQFPILTTLALVTMALAASCARELPSAPALSGRAALRATGGHGGEDISGEVVVTLAAGVLPSDVAASHGATVLEWDADEHVASLLPGPNDTAAGLIAALASDPRVTTSESNSYVEPAEARQKSFAFDDGHETPQDVAEQPALQALHLNDAHLISTGRGVKVAILDTGVDPRHSLLRRRIAGTWNFLDGNTDVTDRPDGLDNNANGVADEAWGHGTHVAGIVAMTAPDAQLLIGRVLDADGQGDVRAVAAGIRWATDNGAQVINLSLGTLNSSEAITNALEAAEARGIVVVASAGNWGAANPQEFPARSSHANAVAASDAAGQPATWTSYGGFVEITAPGVAIRSAYPGDRFRLWSGTSMSAPFVSGTAALLLAVHPDWRATQVMDRIGETAKPLVNVTSQQLGKLGQGMLDSGAALQPDFTPHGERTPDPGDLPPARGR